MNTCSPMFKKADAGASASRTEQNSYAPPGQMTTAGRRSAVSDCISSLGPCKIAVSVWFLSEFGFGAPRPRKAGRGGFFTGRISGAATRAAACRWR